MQIKIGDIVRWYQIYDEDRLDKQYGIVVKVEHEPNVYYWVRWYCDDLGTVGPYTSGYLIKVC